MRPVLAVGWDVGGWHGKKQAVAVAIVEKHTLHWQGEPAIFSISGLHRLGGSVIDLIRLAWPEVPDDVLDQHRVVIAIDASLGFPEMFSHVLTSIDAPEIEDGSFYENPLAFRQTDRWVYRTFGKRPLSASFDKLGNNAITAIIQARKWSRDHGFQVVPQHDQPLPNHTIIEVYPALVKRTDSAERRCHERFEQLLPSGLNPGTDLYDAAICSVLAAAFGATRDQGESNLPPLIHPPENFPRSSLEIEGWIYGVPFEWLAQTIHE